LEWIATVTGLPLFVKGVLRADDAMVVADAGAAGIIVSNHGGRQLDGAIATADALPAIAEAVQGRVPLLVDGGIRSGVDVLRALALGASAVLVGRPFLWGLAVEGQAGIEAVFTELRDELARAMALCGSRTIGEIDRSLVVATRD
jgi:4-hydroxymandelate oxidase